MRVWDGSWCQARGQMPGMAMVRRRLCGDGDDGDGVIRLHGAGQDETMLFEGRATAQLTRQGPRTRSRRVFVQKGAVGQELPSSNGGGQRVTLVES